MEMSFRWYGTDDPVTLEYISQIPAVTGIVTAIYDVEVGHVWPIERIRQLKKEIEAYGLTLSTIESVPVHEDIKLGKPSRDKWIASYIETLQNLAAEGIKTVCYNFMPVFDWTRTNLSYVYPDGSTTLAFDEEIVQQMDPLKGNLILPGWDTSYDSEELESLMLAYQTIDEEVLWDNLEYFLKKVLPIAEKIGIKMAIHPDDPPYSIFGLPRIITNFDAIKRLLALSESPAHGVTLCVASFASDPENDPIAILQYALEKNRVYFVHARNIKNGAGRSFKESAHPSSHGSIDMYKVMYLLNQYQYKGPIRPDHGRMIWGEEGRPGYGLYDRALGAMYLWGLNEAITKNTKV